MKNTPFAVIAAVLLLTAFTACQRSSTGDATNPQGTTQNAEPFITAVVKRLQFGPYEETRTFSVNTNAETVNITAPDWATVADLGNGRYSVKVPDHSGSERSGSIMLTIPALTIQANDINARLTVVQFSDERSVLNVADDIEIPVASAAASEFHPGHEIERSFDGDLTTFYHSEFARANRPAAAFPVILTYNFSGSENIDFLMHHRWATGNNNGNIQKLEIWVAQDGNALQKYGEYDFGGNDARVDFEPPLINPTTIELRVLSGLRNFVSVAEMKFYRLSKDNFDVRSIFTDGSASKLRSGITRETIDNIPDPFFKDLALQMYLNIYDPDGFRTQEYRAWIHPRVDAAANKTNQYSLLDNPTGIFVREGEELLVLVDNLQGQNIRVFSVDLTTGGGGARHHYRLVKGLNKIIPRANGLLYVEYFSDQYAAAPKIMIHFLTGEVNGYFDSQKHRPEDWRRFLDNAVAPDFDLVGKKAHLTFPVSGFKERTPDGKALIDQWDELVRLQHEFMGLYKYDRVFRNRLYAHGDYRSGVYMYATGNRTGYAALGTATQLRTIHLPTLISNPWGAAHEAGHMNQVRPGLRWRGMGEVTVNIYSNVVASTFGGGNRLQRLQRAHEEFIGKNVSHNDLHLDFAIIPFWQLKLYMENALGQADFYKDLHYHYMTNPDPGTAAETDGRFQLHFVRTACKIANLDLTKFFELWGFLTPVEKGGFVITQEQVDALKAEIAAADYPKPPIEDFTGIHDLNILEFTPDHLKADRQRVLEKVEEAQTLLQLHKTARQSDEVYTFETFITPEERNALLFTANRARGSSSSLARQTVQDLNAAMTLFESAVKRGTKVMEAGTNIGQFYASATATFRETGEVNSNEASNRSVDHMMRNTGRWASVSTVPGRFPIDITITFDDKMSVDSMTIFAFQGNSATQGRIRDFDIDYWDGSAWLNCYQRRSISPIPGSTASNGTNGYRAVFTTGSVQSDRFRLAILSSDPIDPSIWHLQLHYAP